MERLAYSIGFFLGDGNLHVGTDGRKYVRFYKPDREPLDRVADELSNVFGFKYKVSVDNAAHVKCDYYRLIVSNPNIFDYFATNTLMRTCIPIEMFSAPKHVQMACLAGLIDSDGYVSNTSRNNNRSDELRCIMGFGNTNRSLVEQITGLTALTGIKANPVRVSESKRGFKTMYSTTLNIKSAFNAGLVLTSARKQTKFGQAVSYLSASETMHTPTPT